MDQIHRFLFEHSPIRGQHVSLDHSWQTIIAQSEAEGLALDLLGQALCAASLLVETLKIDGSVTLQIRGDGPIHMLMAEATSKHTIRGIVRQNKKIGAEKSLARLFNSDRLVITIQNGNSKPYQGIVPLQGEDLSAALQAYFNQSEQLPTRLWLANDDKRCTGLLLQRLPGEDPDDDSWNRLNLLANTLLDSELLEVELDTLLTRLFHQEELRLFEPVNIRFSCNCSESRIKDMLASIGQAELQPELDKKGEIVVDCEFCNSHYRFDSIDIALIFDDNSQLSCGQTSTDSNPLKNTKN